jgi:hypothetical protein
MNIHDSPQVDAKVLTKYTWAESLTPDSDWQKRLQGEWLPTTVWIRGTDGALILDEKRKVKRFHGWVHRTDLWDGKLKKITGCWPVKHFAYEVGDSVVEINFKVDGSGVIITGTERLAGRNAKPTTTQAYISQGIVQINETNHRKEYVFTGGLNSQDHKLYPYGSLDHIKQELFDPDLLKGCKEIPTVE